MTTSATTAVPGHPDPDVVIRAESIFAEMGITPQDAIAIFYKQTVLHGTFPIKELIPNEETVEALESARSNEGTTRYARISIDDEI